MIQTITLSGFSFLFSLDDSGWADNKKFQQTGSSDALAVILILYDFVFIFISFKWNLKQRHLYWKLFLLSNRWNIHERAAGSRSQSRARTANGGAGPREPSEERQSDRPGDGHWRQRQHAGHRRARGNCAERSRRTSCRHGSGAHPGGRHGRRQQRLHHLFFRHRCVSVLKFLPFLNVSCYILFCFVLFSFFYVPFFLFP